MGTADLFIWRIKDPSRDVPTTYKNSCWSFCFFFFFYFFYSFIHHILTWVSPPRLPILPSPPRSSPFPFKTRAGFPEISAEHGITCYNKTGHKPSCQGWMRQLSRRKRVPSTSKRVRDISTPTTQQENQATPPKCICRGPSSDPYRVYACPFSHCELQWTLLSWFCRLCSPGVLEPPGSSYNPFICIFWGIPQGLPSDLFLSIARRWLFDDNRE